MDTRHFLEYKPKEIFVAEDDIINAFLLKKSGNVLTLHHSNNQYKLKVWDIHSKENILTYLVPGSDKESVKKCLSPTGDLLSQINDEVMKSTQYERTISHQSLASQFAFYDSRHLMKVNKSNEKVCFDTYEINDEKLLVKLKVNSSDDKLNKRYNSKDFKQICSVSRNIVCIVTEYHIDFW
jgi:hypothetical protein